MQQAVPSHLMLSQQSVSGVVAHAKVLDMQRCCTCKGAVHEHKARGPLRDGKGLWSSTGTPQYVQSALVSKQDRSSMQAADTQLERTNVLATQVTHNANC